MKLVVFIYPKSIKRKFFLNTVLTFLVKIVIILAKITKNKKWRQ